MFSFRPCIAFSYSLMAASTSSLHLLRQDSSTCCSSLLTFLGWGSKLFDLGHVHTVSALKLCIVCLQYIPVTTWSCVKLYFVNKIYSLCTNLLYYNAIIMQADTCTYVRIYLYLWAYLCTCIWCCAINMHYNLRMLTNKSNSLRKDIHCYTEHSVLDHVL